MVEFFVGVEIACSVEVIGVRKDVKIRRNCERRSGFRHSS